MTVEAVCCRKLMMQSVLNDKKALNLRIYRFPTSAVKLHGNKINYFNFMESAAYEDCNQAVRRIYKQTDMEQIGALIDQTPYISELQKEFYKRYISARLNLIIRPVYEMTEQTAEPTGPAMIM